MYNYNITWNDKVNPNTFNKSCHIKADDISELYKKFNKIYPNGFIWGLVVIEN